MVKSTEPEPGKTEHSVFDLYLDEADERWTAEIGDFDYVIISSGHWHYRPSVYYENNTIIGCRYCQLPNITDFSMFYGYRKAFRTAFKAILDTETFEGVLYLRTFAPSHFEGGLWNEGGNCLRKGPYQRNETQDDVTMKLHRIQVEEFERAEVEAKRKGKRFRLLDTTQAMWLRPDGHPSRYGHLPEANVSLYNDCVHWRHLKRNNIFLLVVWDLDIRSIANKWDVRVHTGKRTPYAFKHCKQISKRNSGPEMHPKLTPIETKRHPLANSSYNLKSDFEQHTHHHMEPKEVRPFFSPHYPKVRYKEVSHQEPAR